jgi:hypothetical protein
VYAIRYHDVGWIDLDREVRWNEQKNAPFAFEDYPLEPKVRAYGRGISLVEGMSPYAGYLVSKHFSSFFVGTAEEAGREFLVRELERQERLRRTITVAERSSAEDDFRLLQFCDDLSLALCLNEPGENSHPWYRDGIWHEGRRYRWIWEGKDTLRLMPSLFDRPFEIRFPYRIVDFNRRLAESGEVRLRVTG